MAAKSFVTPSLSRQQPRHRSLIWRLIWPFTYRNALNRTFARFKATYPEYAATLFDEHFLKHRAAPVLNRYRDGRPAPSPIELSIVWSEQFGATTGTSSDWRIRTILPAAADFLRWLEGELDY